ncbi:MAG: Hsp70 family protein [Mycobacterium sp.]
MSESIGLSIGAANLVAARVGGTPVSRTSVLTVFDNRASEVGVPEENPNLTESGVVMRGFVERVADRSPLVAADGTKYLGAALMVEALETMTRTVGPGVDGAAVTIAVPAYWSENQSAALRDEFFAQPNLAPGGMPPTMISDANAALAGYSARPGFPSDGVVAVCDFGASGTTVTLSNAGADFEQIGASLRYSEFSGDAIDQLILDHLRSRSPDATTADLAATLRQGSLTRLLAECRHAKEQLSAATMAVLSGGQLSRTDFEGLISGPLDLIIGNIEELLQRNGIPRTSLGAVATVGGGASIPLITTRLSERLQVPIYTSPQPMFSAAIGAALLGQRESSGGIPTAMGAAVDAPTDMVASAPTEVAAAAWATHAADDPKSATQRALAWSQDDSEEPVPYAGPDYVQGTAPTDFAARPVVAEDRYAAEAATLPWYKRTALVLSVAGAGAAILAAVVLALTLGKSKPTPNEPSSPPTSITTTVIGPNNSPTVTVLPPPPVTSTAEPSTATTTSSPTTSTTTTTSTTPTTSSTPTSSSSSSSSSSSTPSTTSRPTSSTTPSTTTPPPTTSAAPVTPTTAAPGG